MIAGDAQVFKVLSVLDLVFLAGHSKAAMYYQSHKCFVYCENGVTAGRSRV